MDEKLIKEFSSILNGTVEFEYNYDYYFRDTYEKFKYLDECINNNYSFNKIDFEEIKKNLHSETLLQLQAETPLNRAHFENYLETLFKKDSIFNLFLLNEYFNKLLIKHIDDINRWILYLNDIAPKKKPLIDVLKNVDGNNISKEVFFYLLLTYLKNSLENTEKIKQKIDLLYEMYGSDYSLELLKQGNESQNQKLEWGGTLTEFVAIFGLMIDNQRIKFNSKKQVESTWEVLYSMFNIYASKSGHKLVEEKSLKSTYYRFKEQGKGIEGIEDEFNIIYEIISNKTKKLND